MLVPVYPTCRALQEFSNLSHGPEHNSDYTQTSKQQGVEPRSGRTAYPKRVDLAGGANATAGWLWRSWLRGPGFEPATFRFNAEQALCSAKACGHGQQFTSRTKLGCMPTVSTAGPPPR